MRESEDEDALQTRPRKPSEHEAAARSQHTVVVLPLHQQRVRQRVLGLYGTIGQHGPDHARNGDDARRLDASAALRRQKERLTVDQERQQAVFVADSPGGAIAEGDGRVDENKERRKEPAERGVAHEREEKVVVEERCALWE